MSFLSIPGFEVYPFFFTSISKTLAHWSNIQRNVFLICIWINLVKYLLFYFWRLLAKTKIFLRSSFIKNWYFSNSLRNNTISSNIRRIIFTFEIRLSRRFFNSEWLSICCWPSELHFECAFFIESFCWLTRIILFCILSCGTKSFSSCWTLSINFICHTRIRNFFLLHWFLTWRINFCWILYIFCGILKFLEIIF